MPVEETSLAPQDSSVAILTQPNPVREALTSGEFCYFVELVASATMREARLLEIASHLARVPAVVAGGITSFAGGALGQNPVRIGAAARARGLAPNIHLTCVSRDRLDLRNTLEDMNALGIENVFAITGDYPKATAATSTPYFHLDSVQLVEMISELRQNGMPFYTSVAVSPFKYTEADCAYQYLKLEKKIAAGADYAITQLGFDAKKFRELKRYMDERGLRTPILGNVYVLNQRAAEKMSKGEPPGCWVSPELLERVREEAKAEDKGVAARLERAAQMVAIVKGLGYAGAYLGGEHMAKRIHWIIERSEELAPRWEELAEEITYAPKDGFYFFDAPKTHHKPPALMPKVLDTMGQIFNVKKPGPLRTLVTEAMNFVDHHPSLSSALERAEFAMKLPMFGCQACGNCVLEYTEYVCPQTCPKNLRNGPCGGTLNGHCEVEDKQCVWVTAYERARDGGRIDELKTYVPPRNLALKGTSSWVNYFLDRDSRPGRNDKLINITPAPPVNAEFRRAKIPAELRALQAFDRKVFRKSDVFPAEYWKQCEPYWLLIDGVKAGCCAFDKHTLHAKGTLYVTTTGILPRFQGRGLGQLMKQWQIAYARRHGFTRIVITTRKSNAAMIALNRKFHFKTVRTIPRYYAEPTEPALVMELLLYS